MFREARWAVFLVMLTCSELAVLAAGIGFDTVEFMQHLKGLCREKGSHPPLNVLT